MPTKRGRTVFSQCLKISDGVETRRGMSVTEGFLISQCLKISDGVETVARNKSSNSPAALAIPEDIGRC